MTQDALIKIIVIIKVKYRVFVKFTNFIRNSGDEKENSLLEVSFVKLCNKFASSFFKFQKSAE
jgi:hypothetical protein